MSAALSRLRAQAIGHTLFAPTDLASAIGRMGFIQADPIRAPARAQDLILRLRVGGYRAGDLERAYGTLAVEEDYLYAYGFLAREVWMLLHPRPTRRLSGLERRILERVRQEGATHPRGLEDAFGRRRVVNAWGGYSKATKRALERLHHHGHLRVVGREKGIRVYGSFEHPEGSVAPDERLRRLVLAVVNVLAPIDLRMLNAIAAHLQRRVPRSCSHRAAIGVLLGEGALERAEMDDRVYVWRAEEESGAPDSVRRAIVRFLAPFDPLVWDRRRFAHLFGWDYRFEAYTPPSKRIRGYYALPLLWRDRVVGWVNITRPGGRLQFDYGYAEKAPSGRAYRRALQAEERRFRTFLAPLAG